jgi:hypothetical protein
MIGKMKFALSISGKSYCLNRLVAEYFVNKDEKLMNYILHIDGNFLNCKANNLKWCFYDC